jgi:hypothetical protein
MCVGGTQRASAWGTLQAAGLLVPDNPAPQMTLPAASGGGRQSVALAVHVLRLCAVGPAQHADTTYTSDLQLRCSQLLHCPDGTALQSCQWTTLCNNNIVQWGNTTGNCLPLFGNGCSHLCSLVGPSCPTGAPGMLETPECNGLHRCMRMHWEARGWGQAPPPVLGRCIRTSRKPRNISRKPRKMGCGWKAGMVTGAVVRQEWQRVHVYGFTGLAVSSC